MDSHATCLSCVTDAALIMCQPPLLINVQCNQEAVRQQFMLTPGPGLGLGLGLGLGRMRANRLYHHMDPVHLDPLARC